MVRTGRHHLYWLAATVSIGVSVGCTATPTHRELSAFLKDHEHLASGTEGRIGPGDQFKVESPRIQELHGRLFRVQADGRISARLVGEVRVVGMTSREIASKLEELYAPYYREPDVHVTITDHDSSVFYVFGQVGANGAFKHSGRDTVLTALSRSQPNLIAWKQRVKVIRPSHIDDEIKMVEVNVDQIVKKGDTKMNLMLEPGDIVYVPPTPLGWIGLRLQELLYPVGPAMRTYATPANAMATQQFYDQGVGQVPAAF